MNFYKFCRIWLGYSQEKMAKELGISRPTLAKLEKDARSIQFLLHERYCELVGQDLNVITRFNKAMQTWDDKGKQGLNDEDTRIN